MSELPWILLGLSSELGSGKRNKVDWSRGKEYRERLGYDYYRQCAIEGMLTRDKEKFLELLGHEIDWSKYSEYREDVRHQLIKRDAIKEIAEKEGWRYYDVNELLADPVHRSIVRMERRPIDVPIKQYPEKVLMSPEELDEYNRDVKAENVKNLSKAACAILGMIITCLLVNACIKADSVLGICMMATLGFIFCVVVVRNEVKKRTGSYSVGMIIALSFLGLLTLFYWGALIYIKTA